MATVGSRFGKIYYTVCYDLPVTESGEFFSSDMRMLGMDLGEQEIIVNKDAYIVSSGELGDIMITAREYDPSDTEEDIFNYNEEGRKAQLRSWGRTVEECVDEKYLLDGWYDITDVSSEMRFFVTFDENGAIDSMIMETTY